MCHDRHLTRLGRRRPRHDVDDDGGGDHGRRRVPDVSPKKETWIEKNKKVKRGADGWRQTQPTAHAVRDATHVWKLSRDSEYAPAYEALTDRQERIDFRAAEVLTTWSRTTWYRWRERGISGGSLILGPY